MLFNLLFDLNRDGKLSAAERALRDHELNSSGRFSDEDDLREELEMAGLDYDELADMDEDERREALEDAGLDADDFDIF